MILLKELVYKCVVISMISLAPIVAKLDRSNNKK